jgi:MFS family permease
MPAFFIHFGDFGPTGPYLPSIWTSLWTAMSALVQSLSAFFIGFIMDRYGRKWPGCIAGAITMVGTAVQYTGDTRGALLAGKMLNGVGIGATMAIGTSYASEVNSRNTETTKPSELILTLSLDCANETPGSSSICIGAGHGHHARLGIGRYSNIRP